ncbi:MAG: acetoin utilization protein AcuC [Chloroflexi bacterium]|nr:acetoin utilization protein AcuC [Chloroflexota bacterium]
MRRAAFIYEPALGNKDLFPPGVTQPTRLQYTYELLKAYDAFKLPGSKLVSPREVNESELLSFHAREYIEAVRGISRGDRRFNPQLYNFSEHGDNLAYPGMYEAAMAAVGGSLAAAELVVQGKVDAAFNVTGGHHHAEPRCASGFCIFNDAVIAINYLLQSGLRVAYIDIDAHHGDSVQRAFYSTDQVLTISLHETGRLLFPGTGETDEIGEGPGEGYSVNLPLAPHTDDDAYLWAFRQIVPPLVNVFKPDILVTQLGCDTHYLDPLTHLCLTTRGYAAVVKEIRSLDRPWLALGGGGYDVGVVARSWAVAYGILMDRDWPVDIPPSYQELYGLKKLHDSEGPGLNPAEKAYARRSVKKKVDEVKKLVFPYHKI